MRTRHIQSRGVSLLTVAVVVATLALLGACGTAPGAREQPAGPVPSSAGPARSAGEVAVVARGLRAPWSIVFDGDTTLISERDSARVFELGRDGSVRALGVIDGVAHGGEGGLLGLALRGSELYAYFTSAGDNRIVRVPLTGVPAARRIGAPTVIIEGLPRAANHNGGRIAFGPDGMLYATVGDAGDAASAQNPNSLGGKILRLTPDGGIPADNPFEGSPVFTLGHRNPQGLAWDADGRLFASEFGQHTWDELNLIEAGGNYGWPVVEGIAHRAGFVDPLQQWAPRDASPSGIAVAGDALYIANLRGERLRRVPLDDLAASTEELVREFGRMRDVALAPDGALWVLTSNTDGRGEPAPDDDRVLRIAP